MTAINEILIEQLLNECESSTLDFKKQQYKFVKASDEEKSELLKDILAFSNSFRRTDAFVLIGVEEIKGGRSNPTGISEDIDDATLQQFVNSKTQKTINFLYTTISYKGVKLGVISIPLQERPIYLIKDFGKLKNNVVYIRRGTSTGEATPEEIASMGNSFSISETYKPVLNLQFSNGSNIQVFEINPFKKLTDDETQQMLEEFKEKYPKEIQIKGTVPQNHTTLISKMISESIYGDPKKRESYFKYLDNCYREFEEYLNDRKKYENQIRGRCKYKLNLLIKEHYLQRMLISIYIFPMALKYFPMKT